MLDILQLELNRLLHNRNASSTIQPTEKSEVAEEMQQAKKTTSTDKYAQDIEALKSYFGGNFSEGASLYIELHVLLDICPRKRRRPDAYIGLVGRLEKEYNIKLIITR